MQQFTNQAVKKNNYISITSSINNEQNIKM